MFTVSQTKEKTYTVNDVINFTSNLAPSSVNSTHISTKALEKRELGMALISKYVRINRLELLGTFAFYRIICNGWGSFVAVETDDSERVDAKTVYAHMIKSEKAAERIRYIHDV